MPQETARAPAPLASNPSRMNIALAALSLLCLSFGQCAAAVPFVPRANWTNEPPAIPESLRQPGAIRMVTIHHTEMRTPDGMSPDDEKAFLREILQFHRTIPHSNNEATKWGDIAYHYIIGPSGNVYCCRDPAFQADSGSILRSELAGTIAICLMGDFRSAEEKKGDEPPTTAPDQLPAPAAWKSLVAVVALELRKHGLDLRAVKAHRETQMIQVGSDCPGGLFYPMIRARLLPEIAEQLSGRRATVRSAAAP
jgi:hypothetical protein